MQSISMCVDGSGRLAWCRTRTKWILVFVFLCLVIPGQTSSARSTGNTLRLQNFEVVVQNDPGDENGYLVRFLLYGKQFYSGESRLVEPKPTLIRRTPSMDCDSVVTDLYSGGAHCCTTALLCTACRTSEAAYEIQLGDGPGMTFEDVDGNGSSEVVVSDWAFDYYSPSDDARLCHAVSPAMVRLLVYQAQGWRPDRPGEFPAFYQDHLARARASLKTRAEPEETAAGAIQSAYYAFMLNGRQGESMAILRKHLPLSWRPLTERIAADIRKSALGYNPVRVVK